MPESAAEVYARAVAAAGTDGRLPAPPITTWDVFPWEVVDGAIAPKPLAEPAPEKPRVGDEGGKPCNVCTGFPPDRVVWEDEFWVLTAEEAPTGLPLVLVLHTREHMDFGDLDDDMASQFGRISNRLVRIIQGLENIGRVHVDRWGDGSAHFHVWFFARTKGLGRHPRLVRRGVGRDPAARSRRRTPCRPARRRDQARQLGRSRPGLRRTPPRSWAP